MRAARVLRLAGTPGRSEDQPGTAFIFGNLQIRYKVDSAKYLKYAKQTHFAVS